MRVALKGRRKREARRRDRMAAEVALAMEKGWKVRHKGKIRRNELKSNRVDVCSLKWSMWDRLE